MRVLPRFWCSSRRKNLLSQAFLASLWWVQVKIVLTVKTLYVQEGYKCLILAEGAQKVGEFSCYFSNPPAQRLTTCLVSHSEANPKNNWMRGEQACLPKIGEITSQNILSENSKALEDIFFLEFTETPLKSFLFYLGKWVAPVLNEMCPDHLGFCIFILAWR